MKWGCVDPCLKPGKKTGRWPAGVSQYSAASPTKANPKRTATEKRAIFMEKYHLELVTHKRRKTVIRLCLSKGNDKQNSPTHARRPLILGAHVAYP